MAISDNNTLIDVKNFIDSKQGHIRELPVSASYNCYINTWVGSASGYVGDPQTSTAVLGMALDAKDNSSGSAGDLKVRVLIKGIVVHDVTGGAQDQIRSKVYASDNGTLTTTSGTNSFVGYIVGFISSTSCEVFIDPYNS